MWIASSERSRSLDQTATARYGLPVSVLMERAGLAVFRVVSQMLPDSGRISVLCGKGNNGGDGFVVARLAVEADFDVECLVASTLDELIPSARHQHDMAVACGVKPIFADDARFARKLEMLSMRELIVDALLGTGAHGDIQGPIRPAIAAINRSGVPAISVDVPSGIMCDSGEELGESVWALRTVTFGLPKPYLFQGIGLEHAGYWEVADIGFPNSLLEEPTEARLLDPAWVGNLLPERLRASHKGENGHLLIVAGSKRMRGAATLAAKAAIRAGVGLVTVAGIEEVCAAVVSFVPEATLLPLPEIDGVIDPAAAELLLEEMHRFSATLFGPGMTHQGPILELLDRLWRQWEVPSVIDADALNAVSRGVCLPGPECVLTPHPGEMSRLLQASTAEIQSNRFQTVRQAMMRYDKTILLKGPYSIVGEPLQPMLVNSTGNPGMASAGMGDVLGGIIGTLLAQDLPAYYAAAAGMYLHGAAGDECAEKMGAIGYSARDVAAAIPAARTRITAHCDGNCGG